MKNFNIFALIFTLKTCFSFGQTTNKDSIAKKNLYENISYILINIDTVVNYYSRGEINSPSYFRYDSIIVVADIIFENLPKEIDSFALRTKIEEIMTSYKLNKSFVFRNESSIFLYRLSSMWAHNELKKSNDFLGSFTLK